MAVLTDPTQIRSKITSLYSDLDRAKTPDAVSAASRAIQSASNILPSQVSTPLLSAARSKLMAVINAQRFTPGSSTFGQTRSWPAANMLPEGFRGTAFLPSPGGIAGALGDVAGAEKVLQSKAPSGIKVDDVDEKGGLYRIDFHVAGGKGFQLPSLSSITSKIPSAPSTPSIPSGGATVATAAQTAYFNQIAQEMISAPTISALNTAHNKADATAIHQGRLTSEQVKILDSSFGAIAQGINFGKLGTLPSGFPSVSIPSRLTANLPSSTGGAGVATSAQIALYTQLLNEAKAIQYSSQIAPWVVKVKANKALLTSGQYNGLLALESTLKSKNFPAGPTAPSVTTPSVTTGATQTQLLNAASWKSAISRASLASIQDYRSRILQARNSGAITSDQYDQLIPILEARTSILEAEERAKEVTEAAKLDTYRAQFQQKMASLSALGIDSLDPTTVDPNRVQSLLSTLMNYRNTVPTDWPPEYQRSYATEVDRLYRQASLVLSQAKQAKEKIAAVSVPSVTEILAASDLGTLSVYEQQISQALSAGAIESAQYTILMNAISTRRSQLQQQAAMEDEEEEEEMAPTAYIPPVVAAPSTQVSIVTGGTGQVPTPQIPTQPSVISITPRVSTPSPSIVTIPGAPAAAPAERAAPQAPSWAFNSPAEGPPVPKSLGLKWPWIK